MSFSTPLYGQIREAILTSMLGLAPAIATDADSDYFIRASGVASAVEGLYQHQQWLVRQIFPDTADIYLLERHCAVRRIARRAATAATGALRVTGAAGTRYPVGIEATDANGMTYQTTAAVTLNASGTADINAAATLPGALSNQPPLTPVTLTAPPAGSDAAGVLVTMDSGADVESPASLLSRYLDVVRFPAAGGNKFDWRRWCLEVPGVADAFVYDLRRGPGTVDVAILSSTGIPSAQLVAEVAAHVEAVRPVGLRGWGVLAPAPVVVNWTASVSLTGARSLAQVRDDWQAQLALYLMSQPPGTPILKSRGEALLSEVAGVKDRTVTAPAANVAPVVDAGRIEWATLGAVTVTQI